MRYSVCRSSFFTAAAVCLLACQVQAALVAPSFRDDPPPVSQSSWQQWDEFTPPGPIFSPFTPDDTTFNSAGTNNPFGAPTLSVDSPGSVITSSSKNVYSPSGAGQFSINIPGETGSFDWTKVVVQVRGRGTLLNEDSIELTGDSGTYLPHFYAVELSNTVDPNPFGGNIQETWFQFLIPTNDDEYTLNFAADEANFSLDVVSVDVAWGLGTAQLEELPPGEVMFLENSAVASGAIPEPGTCALLALGITGMVARRRRR